MENTYIDIDAHIREANRLRSEAIGEFLASGWHKLTHLLLRLVRHQVASNHVAV